MNEQVMWCCILDLKNKVSAHDPKLVNQAELKELSRWTVINNLITDEINNCFSVGLN